jgi:hypothetical protein
MFEKVSACLRDFHVQVIDPMRDDAAIEVPVQPGHRELMRAEVGSTSVQDADTGNSTPDAPADDSATVSFFIGPAGGRGEESFDVTVCTPRWLTRELERVGRPIIGRHLLIVDRIDLRRDIEYLTATFQQFRAETWPELGAKLARIGGWEFEDYIE